MVLNIICIFIGCYLAGGIFLYAIQKKIIFQPDVLEPDYQYLFKIPFEEVNITCPSSNIINTLYFPTKHKRKGVIFYHHGNSQDLSLWGYEAEPVTRLGYDVFMYDYPNFGKSKGSNSTESLFSDANFLLKWLQIRTPDSLVILYGRSLGTGIVSKIASENHSIHKVILEAAYYSMSQMAQTFVGIYPMNIILRIKIKSYKYLPKIICPVHLLHGDKDELIPISQAEK